MCMLHKQSYTACDRIGNEKNKMVLFFLKFAKIADEWILARIYHVTMSHATT